MAFLVVSFGLVQEVYTAPPAYMLVGALSFSRVIGQLLMQQHSCVACAVNMCVLPSVHYRPLWLTVLIGACSSTCLVSGRCGVVWLVELCFGLLPWWYTICRAPVAVLTCCIGRHTRCSTGAGVYVRGKKFSWLGLIVFVLIVCTDMLPARPVTGG